MDWCEQRGLHRLDAIRPIHVAAYVEQLPLSRPSVRQHLSAISRCFDWMVSGGTLDTNPATSVQRPRHVVRVGRTPVLSDDQARTLLESISTDRVPGLRDRALIGTMLYTFGRVGAVIAMDVEDYRLSNHQRTFLLHEKGGKEHHVPAHHRLVEYLGEYMDATGLWHSPKSPLFQAVDITKSRLKGTRMNRQIVFQMVRRRARRAGLPSTINCHSFRATGITNYLSNGGSLEDARAIAAHESSQTTRLYDRTGDSITLDEIERITVLRSNPSSRLADARLPFVHLCRPTILLLSSSRRSEFSSLTLPRSSTLRHSGPL